MLNELQIEVSRIVRSNRRTLSLVISRSGEVIVRAPIKISQHAITQFVNRHADWIIKKQKQLKQDTESLSEECAYYLGTKYCIVIDNELSEPFKFDGAFYLSERYSKHKKEILESWFKAQATKIIKPKFIELAEKYSIKFNSLLITGAKARWGSCNNKRNINFSYRLIMADLKAVEYVIVHELAHLIELNHSGNFWNEVKKIMPDYKEHEKYLRLNGHKFHIRIN
ncbi:MAG: SprT family zinc-dependent metalloprotease [Lentisphaerota bacterium]